MKIGIPRERKLREGRVVLTPQAVAMLVAAGHEIRVERGAGTLSGFPDEEFLQAGARLADTLAEVYAADLVVKVKEPQPEEYPFLRPGLVLFCFLHLAAYPEVMAQLLEREVTALAFETLVVQGRLPLLAPMSAIAGKLAVQLGMQHLQQPCGGAGVLLGGIAQTPPGKVVVLGAGVAGTHAAVMASALGADVWVVDVSDAALETLVSQHRNINAVRAGERTLPLVLPDADLLIGAVLRPGAEAPHLVSRAQLALMPRGRVVVDIAIDQGGCIEGVRATDWERPAYWEDGLGFIAVPNLPGAVPRTSAQALSRAVQLWARVLADGEGKVPSGMASAVAVEAGRVVHPALAGIAGRP